MSSVGLGTIQGFDQLVGNTSGFLASFLGADPSKWDILEASYGITAQTAVRFLVLSAADYSAALPRISDSGGRRKIKYTYPYRDGQTTDDLGSAPKAYEIDAVIFGQNYKAAMLSLLSQLDSPQPGILTHPVMGKLSVVCESFQVAHQSEERKAARIRISFAEHTFTIASITAVPTDSKQSNFLKSALTTAVGALKKINSVLIAVEAKVFTVISLKNQVKNLINDYSSFYSQFLQGMNVTFNSGSSNDIPSVLPVNLGGNATPSGSTSSNTFTTAFVNSDPFSQTPLSTNDITGTSSTQTSSLTPKQAGDQLNTLWSKATAIVEALESNNNGAGALDFYDEILSIKQTASNASDVLDAALASSQFTVVEFTTPLLMSIREVAFAAGIDVDRVTDILTLNPSLLSVNYIPAGTTLTVPAA